MAKPREAAHEVGQGEEGGSARGRQFARHHELHGNPEKQTERTESRAVVGLRHDPTAHVRLFGEAVWHRRLSGAARSEDAYVNVRLAAGVSVLF